MNYSIIEEEVCLDECTGCAAYGIIASDGTVVRDITTDYNWITQLIDLLNGADVSRVHLTNIIEDFICDKVTVQVKPV